MSKNKTAKKHSILIIVLFVLVGALLCMSAFNLFKVSTQFTTKTLTTIDNAINIPAVAIFSVVNIPLDIIKTP